MSKPLFQIDYVSEITTYRIGVFGSRAEADKCLDYARAHPGEDEEFHGRYEDSFDDPGHVVTFEEWKKDWDEFLEDDEEEE